LLSVFGVTVFAQVGALTASAGESDHEFSLSVQDRTLPNYLKKQKKRLKYNKKLTLKTFYKMLIGLL
jgi:hypothetical protein